MIAGFPDSEIATLGIALFAAGALTGLLAGLFGVGGGAVIVPVLYEVFRLLGVPDAARMPLCIGTSLAVIVPTSIRSLAAHHAKGAVDWDVLRAWAPSVIVGAVSASAIARNAAPEVYKVTFVVVVGFLALRLIFKRETWLLGSDMPVSGIPIHASGFIIGGISALMGIGGGALGAMVMTLYGRSIHTAVATSAGLGVLISIPGAIGYIIAGWPKAAQHPDIAILQFPMALGYVSVLGLMLIIPTSIAVAPVGARLAHRMPKRTLELAFAIFLLVIAGRFAISLLPT